jgi:hypothetical protein
MAASASGTEPGSEKGVSVLGWFYSGEGMVLVLGRFSRARAEDAERRERHFGY